MSVHPMLRKERPIIATRSIVALAEAIKAAMEDGHQGLQVRGRSRDGKTQASKYLKDHPSWLDEDASISLVSIPRRTNHSDMAFYKTIQEDMKLAQHSRSSAISRLRQIADRLIAGCITQNSTQAIVFIDEAQRLADSDYEYLTNIDNVMNSDNYRLFCIFIHQSDDTAANDKKKHGRLMDELPPHVIGRYFMAEHVFTGLRDIADVTHALDHYDSRMKFEGRYFSEYFAPEAFARGWRLSSHAQHFMEAVASIRRRHGLTGVTDIAMKIFDVVCYRLLVHVARNAASFEGFGQDAIEQTILQSKYLVLEKVRQRQARA